MGDGNFEGMPERNIRLSGVEKGSEVTRDTDEQHAKDTAGDGGLSRLQRVILELGDDAREHVDWALNMSGATLAGLDTEFVEEESDDTEEMIQTIDTIVQSLKNREGKHRSARVQLKNLLGLHF